MKSQIGTSYNLNKQYNFYCTDLTVDKLENFSYGLPNNAIIISSPIDNNSYDIGTPAILMTDYNSNIIPLTYTLDESQFERVKKTNKIKFRESIITDKFTSYYRLLKQIEHNINIKHEAVSYFYYDIYDYYNDISTYYDGVSDYYDTISYYYEKIVEKYDDIDKNINNVKEELRDNITAQIIDVKKYIDESINNKVDYLKTTYILPIYDMLNNINGRVIALEELNKVEHTVIESNNIDKVTIAFGGLRDSFKQTITDDTPNTGGGSGNGSQTETLPPNHGGGLPGGSGGNSLPDSPVNTLPPSSVSGSGNGSQTETLPPNHGGGITQGPTHQQQKPGWTQGLPTS